MTGNPAGPVLEAVNVHKFYEFQRPFSRKKRRIEALRGVSLSVAAGSVMGIAGPSGCGKSTLARCLAGIETPSSGTIAMSGAGSRCCPVQLVVQDASFAINPRFSAAEALSEPLVIRQGGSAGDHRARVLLLMEAVGLPGAWLAKRPSEFSGGQLQRLAIARALAANPRVLILDEALASLDISTAMRILGLLQGCRDRDGLSCLIVSHDLTLLGAAANEIVMMEAGLVAAINP